MVHNTPAFHNYNDQTVTVLYNSMPADYRQEFEAWYRKYVCFSRVDGSVPS